VTNDGAAKIKSASSGSEPTSHAAAHVFISHASQDIEVASVLCGALEDKGLRCWIAPRNVRAGDSYASAIVQAINSCPIMLLVFSKNAAASPHVLREIERASSKGHLVISVRLDASDLPPDFEYFLSALHWLDATGGIEKIIPALIMSVLDRNETKGYAAAFARRSIYGQSAPRGRRGRGTAVAVAVALTAVAGIAAYNWWRPGQIVAEPPTNRAGVAIGEKSVAVLPFLDMSEKKDQGYFGDGISEEISALLAKIPHIKMIGRASSFQFKDHSADLRVVGEKLNAAYIVEGSVRQAGAQIRVTAQLIDAQSGLQLWANSFDGVYDDVLEFQRQIAAGIARALQLAVQTEEAARSRPLQSAEAYTLYMRGLSELDQMHQSSLFDAQSNFERALVLDPSFLRAAEALAHTYVEQAFDESLLPRTAWMKAREVANRALLLDANSAAAHGVLGIVYAANDYNWDAAEAEFSKAFALQPRDPRTLRFAALVTHASGRQEEALRRINASISVDPLNPYSRESLGQILFCMGDLDRAEPALRKSLEITPLFDGSHYYLGMIMLLRGQAEAARREVRAEVAENARDSGMSMDFYARGQRSESDAALARLKLSSSDRWPFGITQAYAFRHDVDRTFEWLEKSYQMRDPDLMINLRGDPLLAPLRADPRYSALLRKMNLPD
jgi:TolB-like protein/Flp pilus assembly protein TadD